MKYPSDHGRLDLFLYLIALVEICVGSYDHFDATTCISRKSPDPLYHPQRA